MNWSIAVTKRLNNGRRRCCLFRKIWNLFHHFVLNSYSIFIEKGKNQHFSSQRMCQSRKCVKTVGVLLMLFLFPFTAFPFLDSSKSWIPIGSIRPANRPFLNELIFRKIIKLFENVCQWYNHHTSSPFISLFRFTLFYCSIEQFRFQWFDWCISNRKMRMISLDVRDNTMPIGRQQKKITKIAIVVNTCG